MSEKTMNRTMTPVLSLWRKLSKTGKSYYLSGKTAGVDKVWLKGFFNGNKTNPKEPDVRIYVEDAEHNLSKETYLSLWCKIAKSGKKYLTGKLDGKWVVGFINEDSDGKRPYLSVYFSEESVAETTPEQTKIEDVPFTL